MLKKRISINDEKNKQRGWSAIPADTQMISFWQSRSKFSLCCSLWLFLRTECRATHLFAIKSPCHVLTVASLDTVSGSLIPLHYTLFLGPRLPLFSNHTILDTRKDQNSPPLHPTCIMQIRFDPFCFLLFRLFFGDGNRGDGDGR